MTKACKDCANWAVLRDSLGHCHYMPPDPYSGLPMTGGSDWCAQFSPKRNDSDDNGRRK